MHACTGKDTILRHEEPRSTSTPANCLASISQLTYSALFNYLTMPHRNISNCNCWQPCFAMGVLKFN